MKRATLKRMSTVLFLVIDGERGGIAVSSVAPGVTLRSPRPGPTPRLVAHLARPPMPVRRGVAGLAASAATTLASAARETCHALADAWRGIAL